MAPIRHLVIDQGSSFKTDVTLSDAYGSPLNLTGYTARGQLRKSYGSNTFTEFTITLIQPLTRGEISIALSKTQTSALRPGRYVYDIEIEETETGIVTRILEGIITVTPEVTR